MTAYSMSHRWVGVITGGAPPPFPTLMTLALNRDLSAEAAGLEEAHRQGVRARQSKPTRVTDRLPMTVWAAALADALGPQGCADLARLKAENNQAVQDLDHAYMARRKAQRLLRHSSTASERQEAQNNLTDAWTAYRDAQGRTRRLTAETATLLGRAIAQVRRMASEGEPRHA